MSNDISITSETKAIMEAVLMHRQSMQTAKIAMELIDSTLSLGNSKEPQDPSTITRAQLKSPINIYV